MDSAANALWCKKNIGKNTDATSEMYMFIWVLSDVLCVYLYVYENI